jgi:uncharacterized RDD family membrane protein YckC
MAEILAEKPAEVIPAERRKPEDPGAAADDLPLAKADRAYWLLRCGSAVIDLGLAGFLLHLAITAGFPSAIMWPFVTVVYWCGCECRWKRTPGKMLFGMRYHTINGIPPTSARLIVRTALRCLTGPFAMLSWRRITLLDLLTGCRVVGIRNMMRKKKDESPIGWR